MNKELILVLNSQQATLGQKNVSGTPNDSNRNTFYFKSGSSIVIQSSQNSFKTTPVAIQ